MGEKNPIEVWDFEMRRFGITDVFLAVLRGGEVKSAKIENVIFCIGIV